MKKPNVIVVIVIVFLVCMLASYNFAVWKVNSKYQKSKFLESDFEELETWIAHSSLGTEKEVIIDKIHDIRENVQFINTICLGDS